MATMPPSQEVQWDLEKAPPGGTFLVLNVGTNTFELGSSCFFQTFPPVPIRSASPPNAGPFPDSGPEADGSDRNAVEKIAAAVAADGGDRGPLPPKSPPGRGRKKGKDDDPDLVRDMEKREKSGSSARRKAAANSKQRGEDGNPSEEASMVGDADASPSSKENPGGPIEVRQDGHHRRSDGGETGTISSVEHPPPYLVNLLRYFGWTVTIDGADGAAYTSPIGVVYHSLSKAFQTFLQDSSRGEEEEESSFAEPSDGGLLQYDSSRGEEKESSFAEPSDGGGTGAPDLNEPTGPSTQVVAKGRLKKRRGRKKKRQGRKKKTDDAIVAIAAPVKPPQLQQLAAAVEVVGEKDGKRPPMLPKEKVSPSKEVNQMAITHRVTRGSSSMNKSFQVQLPAPRRSARLSRKHTFYGSGSDPEDDASLYSPETDEEMSSSLDSDDGNEVCDLISEGCAEQEIPGSEDLDCGGDIIKERNHSGSYTMHQENAALEIRRSGHGSEEQVSITMEVNLERKFESNFVDLFEIRNVNVVKSSEGELSSSAPEILNIVHEEPKSCNNHLMIRETEKFDDNSMVPAINAQGNNTEVKRYMDLNIKDVTEDYETSIEMGLDAHFSNSYIPAVNPLTSENNEEPHASAVLVENTKGGKCVLDNVSAKGTFAEDVVCDASKAQAGPKSKIPEKTATNRKGSKKSLRQGDNLEVQVPLTSTPLKRASKRKSGDADHSNEKRKKRRGKPALAMQKNVEDDQQKEIPLQKKVTALSWLIDAGMLSEGEVLVHKMKNDRTDHVTGLAARNGIVCLCCNKTMSLSKFDIHAGSDLCKPWYNICLKSGKSLMQCQMEVWEKEKNLRKVGFQIVGIDGLDSRDNRCGVCGKGGKLICCDGCPSAFHQDCIMLKDFPEGRWHCPYCVCTFCLAIDGGSDKQSQVFLFTCQQCYRKYHWECTRESRQHENFVESLLHENFAESLLFCGKNCREVDAELFRLLGVVNKIEEGFSWTLLKRLDEHEELNSDSKLLFMMECNRKLSMALSVLNECFKPIVDHKTGVNLISHTVYNCGSNFRRLNYAGFYSAILEKDDEIISVASLRFHGRDLVEMPFIGTRTTDQRQDMCCRRLLKAIEDLLSSMHVKKLIVSATPKLLGMWTTSFAFRPLEQSDKEEIRNFSLVVLPCTSLLQKSITIPKGKEGDLAGATGDPGEVAPGAQDLPSGVGEQQANSGSTTVVGGGSGDPWPRWNLETGGAQDTDKHAAPVEYSQRAAVETCTNAAGGARGGAALLPEIRRPAQVPRPPQKQKPHGSAPAGGGTACGRLSTVDHGGLGGDASSVAVGSRGAGMASGDGAFPAGRYASAFRWSTSS